MYTIFPPFVVWWPTPLMWSRFPTAVERGPFHSIGTWAAPPMAAQSQAVGGRTLPFIAKPRLRTFLIKSRTGSAQNHIHPKEPGCMQGNDHMWWSIGPSSRESRVCRSLMVYEGISG